MNTTLRVAALSLALLAPPCAFAQSGTSGTAPASPPSATNDQTVGEPEEESRVEAIREFSIRQRNEALARARTTQDLIDARMREWQARMDRDWQRADAAGRERMRRTRDELTRQRLEVATWYGGMRHSSADAWEEVRGGFVDAYDDLAAALRRASAQYDRRPADDTGKKQDDGASRDD